MEGYVTYYCRSDLTFDLFGGFDVFCNPPDGADESGDVRQVHLAADKVLQPLQALSGLPARACLQVVDLSFKCLKSTQVHCWMDGWEQGNDMQGLFF